MPFLDRLTDLFSPTVTKADPEPVSLTDPLAAFLFGAMPTLSNVSVTPKSAMTVPAVASAVELIAEAVGTLPVTLFVRNAEGRAADAKHPATSTRSAIWPASTRWRCASAASACSRAPTRLRMLSALSPTSPFFHQPLMFAGGASLGPTLASRPDRGSEFFHDQLATALTHSKATESRFGKSQLFEPVAYCDCEERRIASMHPHEPVPFVRRQFVPFNHSRLPFEVRGNHRATDRKPEMVASTDSGVVANLPEPVGTGGGPIAQDFPEIEFSK